MDAANQQMTERLLRTAVLAGDESAWEYLYRAHFDRLYVYTYRSVQNRHLADELVQDAWLVAVRRIKTFNPDRGTFHQWMRGIVDNLSRNHRRRWKSRWAYEVQAEVDMGIEATPVEQADQISAAMADLPQRYRDILNAKYQEQQSVQEIAAKMRATPKAVESLLSRARAAFRAAWERLERNE